MFGLISDQAYRALIKLGVETYFELDWERSREVKREVSRESLSELISTRTESLICD